jgi:hypothetical protein
VIVKTKLITMAPTLTKGSEYFSRNINKVGTAGGWTKLNGKRHVEGDNPKNMEDGMEHYSVHVGNIDIRFMCGNGKCFNVARGLKQFISATRAIYKDFCLLPLGGYYNNLCIP